MRKTYTKPKFLFESFMMSTSIAAGCEEKTKLPSLEAQCGFMPDPRDDSWVIFNAEPNCTSTPAEQFDKLCYHIPSEDYNLFNS